MWSVIRCAPIVLPASLELGQHVGQVELALGVVGVELRQRVEQARAVERVDPGVDLADRELLGRRVALAALGLDDAARRCPPCRGARARTGPGRRAPSWPSCPRRRSPRGPSTSCVDRLGGDQRHVAGEDHDGRLGVDVLAGRGDRAAGAVRLAPGRRARRPRADGPPAAASGCRRRRPCPAPASSAAATGHRISGRPHSGCRTLGSLERMRVPSPAARMTTVGADTARIVVSGVETASPWGSRPTAGRWAFGASYPGSNPGSPARDVSSSVRYRCEHMFVPRYTEAELRELVATVDDR